MPATKESEMEAIEDGARLGMKTPPTSRWGWLLIVLLVLVPLVWIGLPREIARWYVAAANEAMLDDLPTQARQRVDLALQWYPECETALLLRARLQLDQGELQAAMADVSRVIELQGEANGPALETRSLISQRLGDHDQAIADLDQVVQLSTQSGLAPEVRSEWYAQALNNRAYGRALANRDLERGLQDVQMAIEIAGPQGHFLDTRGYLFYLLERYPDAVKDLEEAVSLLEAERSQIPKNPSLSVNRRNSLERQYRESLAVLYQHRGLAYEKVGRPEEGAADLAKAKEFGYDPKKGIW